MTRIQRAVLTTLALALVMLGFYVGMGLALAGRLVPR